jgi:hypothetical protein
MPLACTHHTCYGVSRRCSEAIVIEDMKKWVAVVNPQIQAFVQYYADKKLEY